MSMWIITCECGHTAGVHGYRDESCAVCFDADCPCTSWTPETVVHVAREVPHV